MSYDIRLFFTQTEFPLAGWQTIMDRFRARRADLPESGYAKYSWWIETVPEKKRGITIFGIESVSTVDTSAISACVYANDALHDVCSGKSGCHWRVEIETSYFDRGPVAVWAQFAIPYHALLTFDGVIAHDCQWHNGDYLYSFNNAADWLEFSRLALSNANPVEHYVELGLMNAEGVPLFMKDPGELLSSPTATT